MALVGRGRIDGDLVFIASDFSANLEPADMACVGYRGLAGLAGGGCQVACVGDGRFATGGVYGDDAAVKEIRDRSKPFLSFQTGPLLVLAPLHHLRAQGDLARLVAARSEFCGRFR